MGASQLLSDPEQQAEPQYHGKCAISPPWLDSGHRKIERKPGVPGTGVSGGKAASATVIEKLLQQG
jgi:hypothetical protein